MTLRLVSKWAWLNLAAVCGLFLAGFGCVSEGPRRSSAPSVAVKGPVEQIHMLTGPAALDFDRVPGPDGFGVRIYASSSRTPATVVISSGVLEIVMFDGVLKGTNAPSAKPLRVWSFPASELKNYEQRTSIGVAYVLSLRWGEARPARDKITILARYLPPKGTPLSSGASAISVAVK